MPLAGAAARDEWGDPLSSVPLLPADKQTIVDGLDPAADCSNDSVAASGPPPDGQSVLEVVRAVGACVTVENSFVPSSELEARTADAVAQPDVISAREATTAYRDSAAFEDDARTALAQDPFEGQQHWWLDDRRVGELDALSVRPGTPNVRVAVIDTGIDDTNPAFPATLTVVRNVSAQALVAFRGNRYSTPPEPAHTTVNVVWRLGSPLAD